MYLEIKRVKQNIFGGIFSIVQRERRIYILYVYMFILLYFIFNLVNDYVRMMGVFEGFLFGGLQVVIVGVRDWFFL